MVDEPTDESPPEDGTVLSPDDLDITAEDSVVELDDGRYVISPGGSEPNVTGQSGRQSGSPRPGVEKISSPSLSEDVVHDWLKARLDAADSKYGFDVTARFEGSVSQRALFSNDVVTTFENLVVWYATHAGSDTPVEDVLGILLMESNLSIRFPPESIQAFARAHGLDGDDSLEDLFDVAREAGGIRFSRDNG